MNVPPVISVSLSLLVYWAGPYYKTRQCSLTVVPTHCLSCLIIRSSAAHSIDLETRDGFFASNLPTCALYFLLFLLSQGNLKKEEKEEPSC